MKNRFHVDTAAARDLGLREASDRAIFDQARAANAVLVTKDKDFVDLVIQRGAPPQVIWLTCGNTSNARLMRILECTFPEIRTLLAAGDAIVEVRDLPR